MAYKQNDNFEIRAGKPIDGRFGPYLLTQDAIDNIPRAQRFNGLIFGVYETPSDLFNSQIIFFTFFGDFSDTEYVRIGRKPIDKKYNTLAELYANQLEQLPNFIYYVISITTYYEYLGTTNGNILDYVPFSGGANINVNILDGNENLLPFRDKNKYVRLTVQDDTIGEQIIITRPPSITISTSPPTGVILEGDEWINNNTWKHYGYYNSFWVQINTNGSVIANRYTHPAYPSISQTLIGATVIASLTTDAIGSITGLTTRNITAGDIGAQTLIAGVLTEGYIATIVSGVPTWSATLNELIETQSTVIRFDNVSGYIHGNTTPINGVMVYDFTGAIRGVVVIVKYNATSFIPPEKSVVIAGYYSPNVDNYIFFELIKKDLGSEVILVTISQDV